MALGLFTSSLPELPYQVVHAMKPVNRQGRFPFGGRNQPWNGGVLSGSFIRLGAGLGGLVRLAPEVKAPPGPSEG